MPVIGPTPAAGSGTAAAAGDGPATDRCFLLCGETCNI